MDPKAKRRRLDAFLKTAFRRVERQPAPEHLLDLVDRLDEPEKTAKRA